MKKTVHLSGRRGSIVAARPFSLKLFLLSLLGIALGPLDRFWRAHLACWANHKGSEGTVKVGTDAIGELRSWELEHTMEPIEDTTLSDTSRTFQSGLNSWTGSATAFWDEGDAGQDALTIGASITLNVYPEGASAGDEYFTGTALVTTITRRAVIQGIVEIDFQFRGTGALSGSTVT